MADAFSVRINGFEMEYCRFGRGDKTFVILPGLSIQSVISAKDAVENGYSIMKDDFTTYLFDRRRIIPENYTVYDMADDTAAVMKELGLRDAYVFGASQGGMIAMVMAIKYPELVAKLVLGSTSAHVMPEQKRVIDRWIELARIRDREGLFLEFGREIYPPEVFEQYKDYFTETAKSVTDDELDKFMVCAAAAAEFNVADKLNKISCPVLALGVYEDAVLDSDATMEIAENLDCREDFALYMYKGYGHAAFDTAPDYRQRIYEFFVK